MSEPISNEAFETRWGNLEACKHYANQLASVITEPCCIALVGTLGAGKTQFVRYMVEAMGGDASGVSSPTFVLVNMYHANLPIAHLDLYRLERPSELESFGFDDIVYGESVCLIEWADKFKPQMPDETLWMYIKGGGDSRQVSLQANCDTAAGEIIRRFRHAMGAEL